jgi:group I intron endonuclease
MPFIYAIKSKLTNQYYIGSTVRINARFNNHRRDLKKNRHHSYKLQEHFNKEGIDDLEFLVLEKVAYNELASKEKEYIVMYNSYNNGFNCSLDTSRIPEECIKVSNKNKSLSRINNMLADLKTSKKVLKLEVVQTYLVDSVSYQQAVFNALKLVEYVHKYKDSVNLEKIITKSKRIKTQVGTKNLFFTSFAEQISSDLKVLEMVLL